MSADARPPLAGALGGGGLFGIGYALGVLDGLRERGLDLQSAPLLGTSAGSWAAAATATGISFDVLCPSVPPRLPDYRARVLYGAARDLFAERHVATAAAVAVRLPSFTRTVLAGEDVCLADQVAASSSVPGLFRPHRLQGVWYLDGGVRSAVSADLATPADLLVVVAPLAGAMFGPTGRYVTRRTHRELDAWRARGGGEVLAFLPDGSLGALIKRPDQLFDPQRARQAYIAGREQAQRTKINR
jgi:predicted acylesterase/phospholipase RssA